MAVRHNWKGYPTLIGSAAAFSAVLPLCLEDSRAPPKAISVVAKIQKLEATPTEVIMMKLGQIVD